MQNEHLIRLKNSVIEFLNDLAKSDRESGRQPMAFSRNGFDRPLRGTTTGRYVVLRLDMGGDNERLLKELSESVLYQVIPWNTGNFKPQVYLDRRWVAIEAPLPENAQNPSITLDQLTETQHGGKIILLGPNEHGTTVSLPLRDIVHCLIGGETGAGKTYTMRSIAYQLANGKNRIVLIDGKRGQGLGILNGIPGQVGPLAIERNEIVNALGWVVGEMAARYRQILDRDGLDWGPAEGPPHLCVFFDEFQVYRKDTVIMGLLQSLAAQGRSARIHLFAGTQKPTVGMFGRDEGGATRAQFGTRFAHRVKSYQASEAIVGEPTPRADCLQPKGDAYIIGNSGGSPVCERVQIAYVPEETLSEFCKGTPDLMEWPVYDNDDGGSQVGRPAIQFTNEQIAAAVLAARNGWGRGRLSKLLEQIDSRIAGTDPLRRLLELGQDINDVIRELANSESRNLLTD